MKPSDVFGICVRLVGLLVIVAGLVFLAPSFYILLWPEHRIIGLDERLYTYYGVLACGVGLCLVRWGDGLARFAYPEPKKPARRRSAIEMELDREAEEARRSEEMLR